MAEPNSITAGILAGTGIGLSGAVLGAQIDALLIGLVAAVFISLWLPSVDDKIKAASSVGLSSLLAGYASPVAASWASTKYPELGDLQHLRLLAAAAVGIACPVLLPTLIEKFRDFIRGRKI